MNPIIRPIRKSDVSQVIALWNEFMQFHSDIDSIFCVNSEAPDFFREHLEKKLEDSLSLNILAEDEGSILGYCLARIADKPPVFIHRKHGYISDLAVRHDQRKQGIGELLFTEAKAWLLAQGADRIELRTVSANTVSNAFWRKMGFITFAEEKFLSIKTEQGAAANP
jgi:ribosomal protein S18 acetylase RimI-like enzyme